MKLLLLIALLTPALPAQNDRHVVLVSLDGFPARQLRDPNLPLPVLRKLIREADQYAQRYLDLLELLGGVRN